MEVLSQRAMLNVLRKEDSFVRRILHRSPYCCVFVWSADAGIWVKADIEGFLYIVERDAGTLVNPRGLPADGIIRTEAGRVQDPVVVEALTKPPLLPHSVNRLIVVNQKTTTNLVEDIDADWDYNVADECVYYRRSLGAGRVKIVGVWIHSADERARVVSVLDELSENNRGERENFLRLS